MTSRDLVVVSLEPWDDVWRRNQYLVAGLLGADPALRVLFVEPPADPVHDLRRGTAPHVGRHLRAVGPEDGGPPGRLWALRPTKWLPRRIDPRGDERRARQVRATATRLAMTNPVLWVNDPTGATLARTSGWATLYDITDDWLLAQRPPRELTRLRSHEGALLDTCAEVVVCSPALAVSKGAKRRVTIVPNAVDVDRYRTPAPRPADLPADRCAVYVGTIHPDRIDVDLCERVASDLSATSTGRLVLVGPVLLGSADIARLERAGASLLGPRESAQVPAYLQHADLLVVPHLVNAFTDSLDPIKLYEYLAVGRPVVSTPVAGFRDQPAGSVLIATTAAFPDAVVAALRSAVIKPDAGPDQVVVPRWSDRVREMTLVLDRVRATQRTPMPS